MGRPGRTSASLKSKPAVTRLLTLSAGPISRTACGHLLWQSADALPRSLRCSLSWWATSTSSSRPARFSAIILPQRPPTMRRLALLHQGRLGCPAAAAAGAGRLFGSSAGSSDAHDAHDEAQCLYEVLGAKQSGTPAELKAAFRSVRRRVPPPLALLWPHYITYNCCLPRSVSILHSPLPAAEGTPAASRCFACGGGPARPRCLCSLLARVPGVLPPAKQHLLLALLLRARCKVLCSMPTLPLMPPLFSWQVLANPRTRYLYELSRDRAGPRVLRAAAASGVQGAAGAAYDEVEVRPCGCWLGLHW